MKVTKKAIITIAACALAIVFFSCVLAVGLAADRFGIRTLKETDWQNEPVNGEYQYDFSWEIGRNGMSGLEVDWINGPIELKIGRGDSVKITEYSNKELKEEDQLSYSASSGVLKIKWKDSLLSFGFLENDYRRLVVEVPASAAGELRKLSCSTASGNITAAGFAADSIKFSTASGNMELSSLKGEKASFSTASGALTLTGIGMEEKLSVSTVSGDVELTGSAQEIEIKNVSAAAVFRGTAQQLKTESVSGPVTAELNAAPETVKMSSVSGDLTLALPESVGFEAEYSSVSGSFSSDLPVSGSSGRSGTALYGTGESRLAFATTSGAMKVERR